jgi:hypothetical protein
MFCVQDVLHQYQGCAPYRGLLLSPFYTKLAPVGALVVTHNTPTLIRLQQKIGTFALGKQLGTNKNI